MSKELGTAFQYLCVCGQTIQVSSEQGGTCDDCGRTYSGQAVNMSMTMTMGPPSCTVIDCEDDDMVGQSLDHFTIVNRLGDGGMGAVYRAMDDSLQRYVAIKVLRGGARAANETEHVERLLQEARAQARVNHANVVHIYFVSKDRQLPYLAMELVPGRTLAERIADKPISYSEVVGIGLQIAHALRESTQFDIVHGDIKPSNILLHEDLAKLSDFGLSQQISQSGPESGKIAGTPNYMSPEVCRGDPATTKSDMYSFGVMLFEMTFGRLPYSFGDSTVKSRLDAHQHATPEFPATWPPSVPESWRPFLGKLLEKNEADRFENWDELIDAMRSLRPLQPVAAGRFARGIAWAVDSLLLTFVHLLAIVPFAILRETVLSESVALSFLSFASLLIVPAFVWWWIGRGGTSPGKNLMQLQVVDRHGLKLEHQVSARRSIFKFLPIWCLPLTAKSDVMALPDFLRWSILAGLLLFLIVEILLVILRRGGRSLHDQVFDSRVVLLNARDN